MKKIKFVFPMITSLVMATIIEATSCPDSQNQARAHFNPRTYEFMYPGQAVSICCYTPPPCEQ